MKEMNAQETNDQIDRLMEGLKPTDVAPIPEVPDSVRSLENARPLVITKAGEKTALNYEKEIQLLLEQQTAQWVGRQYQRARGSYGGQIKPRRPPHYKMVLINIRNLSHKLRSGAIGATEYILTLGRSLRFTLTQTRPLYNMELVTNYLRGRLCEGDLWPLSIEPPDRPMYQSLLKIVYENDDLIPKSELASQLNRIETIRRREIKEEQIRQALIELRREEEQMATEEMSVKGKQQRQRETELALKAEVEITPEMVKFMGKELAKAGLIEYAPGKESEFYIQKLTGPWGGSWKKRERVHLEFKDRFGKTSDDFLGVPGAGFTETNYLDNYLLRVIPVGVEFLDRKYEGDSIGTMIRKLAWQSTIGDMPEESLSLMRSSAIWYLAGLTAAGLVSFDGSKMRGGKSMKYGYPSFKARLKGAPFIDRFKEYLTGFANTVKRASRYYPNLPLATVDDVDALKKLDRDDMYQAIIENNILHGACYTFFVIGNVRGWMPEHKVPNLENVKSYMLTEKGEKYRQLFTPAIPFYETGPEENEEMFWYI